MTDNDGGTWDQPVEFAHPVATPDGGAVWLTANQRRTIAVVAAHSRRPFPVGVTRPLFWNTSLRRG